MNDAPSRVCGMGASEFVARSSLFGRYQGSNQFDAPYRADMVRIVHADANPAGPWLKGRDLELVMGEALCNWWAGAFAAGHTVSR
jgi:hypothetical protein